MITPKIKNILIKFINKFAKGKELDVLNTWVSNSSNAPLFENFIKAHYAITISMNNPDSSEIRKRLLKEIRKDKKLIHKKRVQSIFKYAAISILFIGIGYFFQNAFLQKETNNIVVPKEEFITLELENGNIQVISEDGSSTVVDVNGKVVGAQQGDKLIYKNDKNVQKLVYNKLTVPYGKKFDLILSDGTSVFLNSGSSIKYPVKFIKGLNRQVYLTGEAFFDVAKDKTHPFVVDTKELNVQVLGTKFNVQTYEEDSQIDVILVEGSVGLDSQKKLNYKDNDVVLEPGYKGSYNKRHKNITTKKVNTSIYTSWMTGTVVFRNTPFREIVKKLERLYNVTIIVNNKDLIDNENFNASIEVENETIEQVLNCFNKVYEIEYNIINNEILIN
ncbi:FecR family protein [Maribacter vaceletii]|uniref:FecR family protein n=1 Tax=Maribacter vaceletii TaxID=1206816 RepID=A0A495EC72_9FLAO|nr:FecR family protein [Maribacter vaceletii]RKR14472.1 FecR family protein [Maribacter vaceletii]